MKRESTVVAILVGVSVGVLLERWLQRDNAPRIGLDHLQAFVDGVLSACENKKTEEPESVEDWIPPGWGIWDGAITAEMDLALREANKYPRDVGCELAIGDILEPGYKVSWKVLYSDDPRDRGGIVIFRREKAADA